MRWHGAKESQPDQPFTGRTSKEERAKEESEESERARYISRDFPDGPVVKNPASKAGEVGLIPGQGTRIPLILVGNTALEQLSPHTTTKT